MSAAVIPTRRVPPARAGAVVALATRAIAAAPISRSRSGSLLFRGMGFLLMVELKRPRYGRAVAAPPPGSSGIRGPARGLKSR